MSALHIVGKRKKSLKKNDDDDEEIKSTSRRPFKPDPTSDMVEDILPIDGCVEVWVQTDLWSLQTVIFKFWAVFSTQRPIPKLLELRTTHKTPPSPIYPSESFLIPINRRIFGSITTTTTTPSTFTTHPLLLPLITSLGRWYFLSAQTYK